MTAILLAVYAHPDDEAFGVGGTLAYYSARGVRTALICATRGEVGEISDPALATPETLGVVREQELRCACEALGVQDLYFLDYRDSGMKGTPENDDERNLYRANPLEVIEKLVKIIRDLKPQVVITFEPYGGYGHPDHIAISKHTTASFGAAADPEQYPEAGAAWKADRLFYSTIPAKFFSEMREKLIAAGVDVSEFPSSDDMREHFPDEKITTLVDVSAYTDNKMRAATCHATQFGENNFFRRIPDEIIKHISAYEYFALIQPAPEEFGAPEHDLFEGLAVSE